MTIPLLLSWVGGLFGWSVFETKNKNAPQRKAVNFILFEVSFNF